MWSILFEKDPLDLSSSSTIDEFPPDNRRTSENRVAVNLTSCGSIIVKARVDIDVLILSLVNEQNFLNAFKEGGKIARTTLAHLFCLKIADSCPYVSDQLTNEMNEDFNQKFRIVIEPLHFMRRWKKLQQLLLKKHELNGKAGSFKKSKTELINTLSSSRKQSTYFPPYIMERTDVWCDDNNLNINLAVIMEQRSDGEKTFDPTDTMTEFILKFLFLISTSVIQDHDNFLANIANTVLQHKLRSLLPSLNAVAFIANGSIMPRRSGASFAPMSAPPAIPFIAPEGSNLTKQVYVHMGKLTKYVKNSNLSQNINKDGELTIVGMVIPKGISLIVGGMLINYSYF